MRTSLYNNASIDENSPNWAAYRLSLDRMKALQSESTHWRFTCSFPAHGVDYRDYVRANFTEFDPLTFQEGEKCKKTEYMNVRGHNCTGCTSAWWQPGGEMIHHDSSYNRCEFGSTSGAVASEDNFGYYRDTNPSFRCSSSDDSTTNHWFGRRVAWTPIRDTRRRRTVSRFKGPKVHVLERLISSCHFVMSNNPQLRSNTCVIEPVWNMNAADC